MNPATIPVPVYGGTYRGACPRESVEQISFFNKIRAEYPDTYGRLAVHIRNEDTLATAQKMKKHKLEGLTTGASDIQIPGCPSFVCEMKRMDPTKSTLSDDQSDYLVAAQTAGAYACVAFGAQAAVEAFEHWLGLQAGPAPF